MTSISDYVDQGLEVATADAGAGRVLAVVGSLMLGAAAAGVRYYDDRRDDEQAMLSVAEQLDLAQRRREQGNWVPAAGGTEQPFRTRSGFCLLYVWQPSTGRHAYCDLGTDLILSDDEALAALGKY
jgi:hypothetical protein